MKIDDVLKNFEIFTTNEERVVLERMEGIRPMAAYTERERFVIENLIRKSLVSKILHNKTYMVRKND
jgi:hypothetical protein